MTGSSIGNRATAFHEAGHAVAAIVLGVPFDRVSIVPDTESLGRAIFSGVTLPADWFHELSRDECDLVERRIIVALCGPEAERLCRQRSGYQNIASDWGLVADLLKLLPLGAEGIRNYHDWLKERARSLVDGGFNQRAICVAASSLEKSHALSAQDVGRIVNECRNRIGADSV